MTFAQRIAAIRKKRKLSQEKLGELAGVSQRSVAFWESGARMPSNAVLTDLAQRLDVSVDYLLGLSDEPKRKEPAVISDDELLADVISRIQDLPDPALSRVADFLDGLQAGREVAAAQAAPPDPAEESRS